MNRSDLRRDREDVSLELWTSHRPAIADVAGAQRQQLKLLIESPENYNASDATTIRKQASISYFIGQEFILWQVFEQQKNNQCESWHI